METIQGQTHAIMKWGPMVTQDFTVLKKTKQQQQKKAVYMRMDSFSGNLACWFTKVLFVVKVTTD